MNENIEAKLLAWACDPDNGFHKICDMCNTAIRNSRYRIAYFAYAQGFRCFYDDKHCFLCNEIMSFYYDVTVVLPRLSKDITDAIIYRSQTDKFREAQNRFNS